MSQTSEEEGQIIVGNILDPNITIHPRYTNVIDGKTMQIVYPGDKFVCGVCLRHGILSCCTAQTIHKHWKGAKFQDNYDHIKWCQHINDEIPKPKYAYRKEKQKINKETTVNKKQKRNKKKSSSSPSIANVDSNEEAVCALLPISNSTTVNKKQKRNKKKSSSSPSIANVDSNEEAVCALLPISNSTTVNKKQKRNKETFVGTEPIKNSTTVQYHPNDGEDIEIINKTPFHQPVTEKLKEDKGKPFWCFWEEKGKKYWLMVELLKEKNGCSPFWLKDAYKKEMKELEKDTSTNVDSLVQVGFYTTYADGTGYMSVSSVELKSLRYVYDLNDLKMYRDHYLPTLSEEVKNDELVKNNLYCSNYVINKLIDEGGLDKYKNVRMKYWKNSIQK